MIRSGEMVCLVMLIILSTYIFLYNSDVKVEAVGAPVVSIDLHQTLQTAVVGPDQECMLLFTGEVSALVPWSPRVQYLEVTLTYDAMGWVVAGTQSVIFTPSTDTMPFSCSVQVPPATSSATAGQLTVGGTWSYDPGVMGGSVPPATAVILVDQYYAHALKVDEAFAEMERVDTLAMTVTIENQGNGPDMILIEADYGSGTYSENLMFELSTSSVLVDESSSDEFYLYITTDGTPLGSYSIDIETRSQSAEESGDLNTTPQYLTVHIKVVKDLPDEEQPNDQDTASDDQIVPIEGDENSSAEEDGAIEEGTGTEDPSGPDSGDSSPQDIAPISNDTSGSGLSPPIILMIVIIAATVLVGVPAVIIYIRAKRID